MAFKMKYGKSSFPFKLEEDPIAAAAAKFEEGSGDASSEISSIGSNYAEGARSFGASVGAGIKEFGEKWKEGKKAKEAKKKKEEEDDKASGGAASNIGPGGESRNPDATFYD
jgi:hypothetical protein